MSIYDFHIEMASGNWEDEGDEWMWKLVKQLEAVAEKSELQFNFSILQRDGKEFPKSKKKYDSLKAHNLREEKKRLERNLHEAEKRVTDIKGQLGRLK